MEVNKISRPTFFTLAANIQLNVHDLNNEAVAGNVTDIRMMEFIDNNGKLVEAPAVSGRMLKHFHLAFMRDLELREQNPRLCGVCQAGEPARPGYVDFTNNRIKAGFYDTNGKEISEDQGIINCLICDVHGYLYPEKREKKTAPPRRNSRAMFSWLLPVLVSSEGEVFKEIETTSKQVLHARHSKQEELQIGNKTMPAQELFNKAYASGMYGFVSAVDLERIGYLESQLKSVLQDDDWKHRAEISIKAYQFMLSGALGASLSHSIPHADCKEVLVAIAEDGPLPFPISPIYPRYAQKYIGLLGIKTRKIEVYTFGIPGLKSTKVGIIQCDSISEIFNNILEKIE